MSFIIPVYNVSAAMLGECIESILALSLRSFEREIIIVDDGSDEPIMRTLEPRLLDQVLCIRQKNGGVSEARNLGLRVATGRYIQFVDGDDLLLRAPYEHVLDLLRYDKATMVMFDFAHTPAVKLNYDDEGPITGTELMRRTNIYGAVWSYVFSRSLLGNLRFTIGRQYGEDEEFTAQLVLRSDSIYKTTAVAYYYRLRPASAINSDDMQSRLQRLDDSRDVLFSLQQKADRLPVDERTALLRRTAQLTMDYIYNVIILTRNRQTLELRLDELRQQGLFPLPDRDYTEKYAWFRRMTNSKIGLLVLLKTLPLMKRER